MDEGSIQIHWVAIANHWLVLQNGDKSTLLERIARKPGNPEIMQPKLLEKKPCHAEVRRPLCQQSAGLEKVADRSGVESPVRHQWDSRAAKSFFLDFSEKYPFCLIQQKSQGERWFFVGHDFEGSIYMNFQRGRSASRQLEKRLTTKHLWKWHVFCICKLELYSYWNYDS